MWVAANSTVNSQTDEMTIGWSAARRPLQLADTATNAVETSIVPTLNAAYRGQLEARLARAVSEANESSVDAGEPLTVLYKRQPLVRQVLDANDHLRSIGLGTEFDFPSIVAIGDQSAGKSSVLEAVSGVQLLRGSGVVTRAPVELRLDGGGPPGGGCVARVEATGSNRRVVECDELGAAINDTMRSVLWSNRSDVTETPIRVRVTKSGVPDLTLVDLPGLARVAVQGQSPDVPRLTKALAAHYVASPNTIILVVVPCNADLATAEALQLAAEADPEGTRTVGVLTKPDLMDPGTEHSLGDVLDGRVVRLKQHGYFVVRNRGQLALDGGVELDVALRSEHDFFERHPIFSKLWRERHPTRFGAGALVRYLTKVLVGRIAAEIPALRARVEERLLEESAALAAIARGHTALAPSATASSRQALLLQLTTDFSMSVRETTRGHYDMLPRQSEQRRFMADLLSYYSTFHEDLNHRAPRVDSPNYDAAVRHAVATQHGRESFYGFPSYAIFAELVRDLIGRVHAPAEACASRVRARVLAMARAASADLFAARFPKLRRALDSIAKRLADERHADALASLDMLLEMQMQPFTQELLKAPTRQRDPPEGEQTAEQDPPDDDEEDEEDEWTQPAPDKGRFFGRATGTGDTFRPPKPNGSPKHAPPQPPVKRRRSTPVNTDAVDFVKSKIERYFAILAERLGDLVPMAIDMYLVQKFGHDLALRVANATHAFSDLDIQDLLRENADLARRRRVLEDTIAKLATAREVIDDFSSATDVVSESAHHVRTDDECSNDGDNARSNGSCQSYPAVM